MQRARRAVIDVGTNSVKLLLAEVEGSTVHPLREEGHQTRLGEGFYETHRLQPEALLRTALAVAEFAGRARAEEAESIRVIATSAARDAVNPQDLVDAVARECGLAIEIISGEQEAEWAYLGVGTDPAFAGQRLCIMDAGGGSTQFIFGEGPRRAAPRSFPIGAVRLLERFRPGDPPAPAELEKSRSWLRDFIERQVKPQPGFGPAARAAGTRLVATGGTAAIFARMELGLEAYDRARLEAVRLGAGRVTHWVERLWAVSLAERKTIRGLPALRADVILTGAAIYEAVLNHLEFAELRVSTRGLRFGAVLGPTQVEQVFRLP
jgi:exopolyphosphatase / guanosine-5'-triphosphate,3'-diphosphate pyrophosphatase